MTNANLLHDKKGILGSRRECRAGEPVRVICITDTTNECKRFRNSWRCGAASRERLAERSSKPEKHVVASYRVSSG